MNNKKVWFVTGASKGLGLSLVTKLLQQGYRVAATSRNKDTLLKAVSNGTSGSFLALETDLGNPQSVTGAVKAAHDAFGRLDVIVNNAGYGIGGALEELSDEEIHESFSVNVFGTINVIKAAMPYLRSQRSGHIINISSIAGFAAATGWSVYAATKFAVVGLTEVLADDVRSLGINATVVEPGAFRTSFLTKDSLVIAKNSIDDYEDVHASHARYFKMDGEQAGDPDKAADIFIQLAENPKPPVRLFLGSDAYNRATQKLDLIRTGLEEYKDITTSTDYQGSV